LLSYRSYPQELKKPNPNKNVWFSLGGGFNTSQSYSAFGAGFSLSYANDKNIFTLRYTASSNLGNIEPLSGSYKNRIRNLYEYGALYGIIYRQSLTKFSASVGLSYLDYDYKFNKDLKPSDQVGIPLQFQVILSPIHLLGCGLTSYANLNTNNSMFGVLFTLYLGKVR
jgi:hypothetical protein